MDRVARHESGQRFVRRDLQLTHSLIECELSCPTWREHLGGELSNTLRLTLLHEIICKSAGFAFSLYELRKGLLVAALLTNGLLVSEIFVLQRSLCGQVHLACLLCLLCVGVRWHVFVQLTQFAVGVVEILAGLRQRLLVLKGRGLSDPQVVERVNHRLRCLHNHRRLNVTLDHG